MTGLLAEPENADDRDPIIKLLEDDNLRAEMREQCRQVAVRIRARSYNELSRCIRRFCDCAPQHEHADIV